MQNLQKCRKNSSQNLPSHERSRNHEYCVDQPAHDQEGINIQRHVALAFVRPPRVVLDYPLPGPSFPEYFIFIAVEYLQVRIMKESIAAVDSMEYGGDIYLFAALISRSLSLIDRVWKRGISSRSVFPRYSS